MLQDIPLTDLFLSTTEAQVLRRESFDPTALEELAESVGRHGVLQPIVVRQTDECLEIVAGERRYLAAQKAGLDTIPGIVREMTDQEAIEIQLIENLQRAELHPMEEAEGYQQLLRTFEVSMEELHARVGKSKSYVYKRLKLLGLSTMARQWFYQGKLNTSCALELAKLDSHEDQDELLEEWEDCWGDTMTAEEIRMDVSAIIHRLLLDKAPFPIDDESLVPVAGPCLSCPKRTSAQPELFDVDQEDRCTDSACWKSKAQAHGDRVIEQATNEGREIIQGDQAKKACRFGTISLEQEGFYRTDERSLIGGQFRKVSSVVGKKLTPAVMVSPEGEVLEVYRKKDVEAIAKEKFPEEVAEAASRAGPSEAELRRKAKAEKEFRLLLWTELREKMPPPALDVIARHMVDNLDFDSQKLLAKILDWEPPEKPNAWGGGTYKDFRAIPSVVDTMTSGEISELIQDCLHLHLLEMPHAWMDIQTPKKLRGLAKEHGIDTRKLRAAVRPKPKKKTATKKTTTKRS